jgi:hypothetical protein
MEILFLGNVVLAEGTIRCGLFLVMRRLIKESLQNMFAGFMFAGFRLEEGATGGFIGKLRCCGVRLMLVFMLAAVILENNWNYGRRQRRGAMNMTVMWSPVLQLGEAVQEIENDRRSGNVPWKFKCLMSSIGREGNGPRG